MTNIGIKTHCFINIVLFKFCKMISQMSQSPLLQEISSRNLIRGNL
ncbi:hypothetical protein HanXRQr2_Chr08g0357541 [Helianthus annuus]|uniref:Uncharacterized protein n=1 Tax=Helianthus annuus TaxID=4232 RepID=A0A9K3NE47_HELAN|nr:hypothetical protein HanXRQr2_Chr08g0357541 [Helianthus annuus]KAJ0903106.1 hypothetical protein HanPSC8_Chr08g0345161 [Helianthus annuus]